MNLTMTATATTELKIAPALKRRTLQTLKTYADLKRERDALDAEMDKCKGVLGDTLDSLGESAIELDGYKVTRVAGTYKKLNEQKLVELGCAVAWIREATEDRPKKAYTKVTVPGQKGGDE